MIKKITIALIILVISFVFFGKNVYANPGPAISTDITRLLNVWELEENNGIHTIRSNRIENKASWITAEINTFFGSSQNPQSEYNIYDFVVAGYGPVKSRVEVFSDATTTHRTESFNFVYEAPEVTQVMFLSNGNDWKAEIDKGMYYSITFVLNENLTASQKNRVLNVMNAGGAWGETTEVYNFTILAFTTPKHQIIIDPTKPEEYALLPSVGSIFDVDNPVTAPVTIIRNDYNVLFEIRYDTIYTINYTFSAETDMSIFNNAYEAFFYTHEDTHFILISHGTESMFTRETQSTFIPYTIWNLETNEISTINKIDVHMFVKEGDAQNVFAYFYVDAFIIDNLLSVTTFMEYRYISVFGGKGDWTSHHRILEDDVTLDGNVSWKLQAAATSTLATTFGAMIPKLGFPILIIGTPISLFLQYLSYQEMVDGNMLAIGSIQEIERYTPNNNLKAEIQASYHASDSDFSGLDLEKFDIWKLHLGTFNKVFQDRIEIREGSLSVIQFKYQTDGRVYTIESEQINTIVDLGQLEETPDIPNQGVLANISELENIKLYLFIAGGVIFLMVLPKINKSFKDVGKGVKLLFTPFGLFTAIIIIVTILYFTGNL